jgi:cbb3-type cytochrome oxidase maturation protein
MNILLVLIPVSLLLVGVAVWAFFWAANTGQFDDLDSPGVRMLLDEHDAAPVATTSPPDDSK